jgi:uncharacterized membrane protein YtjA (UPF0391 family)
MTATLGSRREISAVFPFTAGLARRLLLCCKTTALFLGGRTCFTSGGTMLHWAAVFFVIALIAALFGFGGIAAGAAGIAKMLFVLFIILALIAFIVGRRAPI